MAKIHSLRFAAPAIIAVLIIFGSSRLALADPVDIDPKAACGVTSGHGYAEIECTNNTGAAVYDLETTWVISPPIGESKGALVSCQTSPSGNAPNTTCTVTSGTTAVVNWSDDGLANGATATVFVRVTDLSDVGLASANWTVPEPPTALLFGTALLALAVCLWGQDLKRVALNLNLLGAHHLPDNRA
jgi:hypothetical protein